MKRISVILAILSVTLGLGQQTKLTAEQIIDSSLIYCGGEQKISKIRSNQIDYLLIQPDNTTAIVSEKIKSGEKYVQSILSMVHIPQTTFFDGKKIRWINGNSVLHIDDLKSVDEIKLKTFAQIQYGYKKLNYKFLRLPDQKFENFDCYVVDAASPNGYKTTNFFDKNNFRLLMVVYPNGNKSALVDYIFKDDVLFNSHVVNTFSNSKEIQILKLQNLELNADIADVWFACPYLNEVSIPIDIRVGKFTSSNGPATTFNRTTTSVDYIDKNDQIDMTRFLKWNAAFPDEFELSDKPNENALSEKILVKIVSWNDEGYVCQWITNKYFDTQDYKKLNK